MKLTVSNLSIILLPLSWRWEWVASRWTSSTSWAQRPCSTSPSTVSTRRCGQQDPPCSLPPGPWASRPGPERGSERGTSWSRTSPSMTAGYALFTWSTTCLLNALETTDLLNAVFHITASRDTMHSFTFRSKMDAGTRPTSSSRHRTPTCSP